MGNVAVPLFHVLKVAALVPAKAGVIDGNFVERQLRGDEVVLAVFRFADDAGGIDEDRAPQLTIVAWQGFPGAERALVL